MAAINEIWISSIATFARTPISITIVRLVALGVVAFTRITRRIHHRLLACSVPNGPIGHHRKPLHTVQVCKIFRRKAKRGFLDNKSMAAIIEIFNQRILIIAPQSQLHFPNLLRNRSLTTTYTRARTLFQIILSITHCSTPGFIVPVQSPPGYKAIGITSHNSELVVSIIHCYVCGQAYKGSIPRFPCSSRAVDSVTVPRYEGQDTQLAIERYVQDFYVGILYKKYRGIGSLFTGDPETIVLVAVLGGAERVWDVYVAATIGAIRLCYGGTWRK